MTVIVPKIHLVNRGEGRRSNYWARYTVKGHGRVQEPTGASTLVEAQAWAEQLKGTFRAGKWLPPGKRIDGGAVMFAAYAQTVIARRIKRGVKGALKDESNHVRKHLVPLFGELRVEDLQTFKVVRDKFVELEAKGLAGSTVRNIHSTLRAILIEAAEDEIIRVLPPPLTTTRGHLPPAIVNKPEDWLKLEISSRNDVAALLSCERIETQYRVMHGVYFLTGSRFNEVTKLHVANVDRTLKPLGSITLRALKTRRDKGPMYRVVPIHPDLRPWVDWWLDEEYEALHGAHPQPGDLLFPSLSPRRQIEAARRGEDLLQVLISHGELYKRFIRHHLRLAGLDRRRLHSSRSTFISLVRSTGRSKDAVRAITHRTTRDKVLDAYTQWEWQTLCDEMSSIPWRLPAPPERSVSLADITLSDDPGAL